jgi:hypothetical protein
VERRAVSGPAGTENWVRLNARVTPEPLYDDPIGLASDVKLEYRVLAVAFDNSEGSPSASVPVTLADRSLPETPSIVNSSGADGKAQLDFAPALPTERTAQFLVLRSGSERDIGVVIGDPLPGSARQFTDLYTNLATPYPHVVLQFQPPPPGLSLIVERRPATGSGWIRIAGPMSAPTATDNSIPNSGSLDYRISYVAANGQVGPAGAAATIAIP